MFYGAHFIMSPPTKSKLKRQSQLLSSMLSRTLSYKYRDLEPPLCSPGASDDPAELSTQLSAPGVLKVFGDSICLGTHYKSVLATASSSAQELVREALERYALSPEGAGQYVLCDAVGRSGSAGQRWQAECFRVFGDNEKPLLIQELWKPREGLSRRFELRKRSDVEELAARDVDTVTAGINAQARRLQRTRAKGTARGILRPSPPCLRRSLSETSLNAAPPVDASRPHYATLPASPGPEELTRDTGGPEEEGAMRHSLYQSPHLLLLQGYSQQHDSLVYVLNRDLHTVGQRTPASRPTISLVAPDILPLHCTIRRHRRLSRPTSSILVLEPIEGAPVAVNFTKAGSRPVELHHGDLLSLGLYYLLLFKDPLQAQPLPVQALAHLGAAPRNCRLCGAALGARGTTRPPQPGPEPIRRRLHLAFEPSQEDVLLQRILTLVEPAGDDHKLTPAFLLCLCVQHAAACFGPGAFGQLLLKMAGAIRDMVWEKTKELAEKQAQLQEPAALWSVTVAELAPDLQHLLFWMANAVELLFFLQQRCPHFVQTMEEALDAAGSKESLLSCVLTASEEAMGVLEEVVLYAFQQCVYYISKSLYACLPALLECPPFPVERRESWSPGPCLPEELRRVVSVYQATLDLLRQFRVHPEIAAQMLAYLLFFSGTLLLNQLLDKGPSLSCFHWPQGVLASARLQQLLEWVRGAGLGAAGEQFFRKLSCTLNLLATPSAQLVQMTWATLRATFPALRPAQLHRLLTQYQLASAMGPTSAWEPGAPDCPDACKSDDVLESYENPPPIVLPSDGFQVELDLEVDQVDDSIYQHLLYVRHFLWGLQSRACPGSAPPPPECLEGLYHSIPEGPPDGQHAPRGPSGRSRQPSRGGPPPTDTSCLLTPPSTPLSLEPLTQDWPMPGGKVPLEGRRSDPWNGVLKADPEASSEAPSTCSSSPDTPCAASVVVVELERGPSGLGMGLVDGMHTPLGVPGLYIQTLLPGSPAACDGRLSLGDRILDVDGTSLVGISYLRAVDLIRNGANKVRFLVAKSDVETARKVRFRAPRS
ncbi:PREDICTED: ras-associating and dilute domain-containing protein [Chrysochloris asiatica]|uniref:Ras-associating and dilute domain-containing protein n=1 Tax=Chrysochloris asiatica TaxID=185453 RepID=A0A9B0T9Y4_CHRAS|nr:PREDICTED: ras-associating and dilute domain-containing protein [Chrysochloris asiatica]